MYPVEVMQSVDGKSRVLIEKLLSCNESDLIDTIIGVDAANKDEKILS